MSESSAACFHCGTSLPERDVLWTTIRDERVPVCCEGCKAAASLIAGLGLEDFYRFRSATAVRPEGARDQWSAYDRPDILERITRCDRDGRSVVLLVDGLTCAACGWLLTQALQRAPGVRSASVNAATGRAQVVWDTDVVQLSKILSRIDALGFHPHPIGADALFVQAQAERHALLKRLAVAGLGMMQVMMFAVALYAGEFQGMEPVVHHYLRIVSLIVTTPVLFYAGWPYLMGAYRALRVRSITMDVPVSLGMVLAFCASVFNTMQQAGDVYFDSVVMFVFFLTVARYIEMVARHVNTNVTDSLSRLLPLTAHRIAVNNASACEDVLVSCLTPGDTLLVRMGEVVPADGSIVSGVTRIDESMLTGESRPVSRTVGDSVTGGTLNVAAPFEMTVNAVGATTVLASIVSLLNRAQAERPRLMREADRRASKFLLRVLIGAGVVGIVWSCIDPARAFAAMLAVLVVACPCALSLATLVAVASATTALAKRGVLVVNPDAIEALGKVSRVVFDKTGTLTTGRVSLASTQPCGARTSAQCMEIAAALETASEHPIAKAFVKTSQSSSPATNVCITSGGIEGAVNGEVYRLGTRDFATELHEKSFPRSEQSPEDAQVVLADSRSVLCTFTLSDSVRLEAYRAVSQLKQLGVSVEVLSGDALPVVRRIAGECGITEYRARQSPADKLQRVHALTQAGEFVAMVGDGINDAPVLGGAGLSVAMSRGSPLALASSDLILVNETLTSLPEALALARYARRVIKQNLMWAMGYNLSAMPLAALGWIPPWLAAIGMSASSIFVVINALRVVRRDSRSPIADKGRTPSDWAGEPLQGTSS